MADLYTRGELLQTSPTFYQSQGGTCTLRVCDCSQLSPLPELFLADTLASSRLHCTGLV